MIDPPDRPRWVDAIDNPYLHGAHAPTVHETPALAFHAKWIPGERVWAA